jgi:transposase-like protein
VRFQPGFCPCQSQDCGTSHSFQYQRRGTFTRACDGRKVQRFQCKGCKRTFSTQTFRVDYRLRRPALDGPIFCDLVSKVTQRQITRKLFCNRRTVARRLMIFGRHCQAFHERLLHARDPARCWQGRFLLDELETYEQNRRLKPVTVPVLVHRPSHCILHTSVGTLPPRRPLLPANQKKLVQLELTEGRRRSESRTKVAECFQILKSVCASTSIVRVNTDQKHAYRALLKEAFGDRMAQSGWYHAERPIRVVAAASVDPRASA